MQFFTELPGKGVASKSSSLADIIYNSNILTSALLIDINSPLATVNMQMGRCYKNQGTQAMPEGVNVAYRKPVMRYDQNNILVELYETAPVYGRIWINKYSLEANNWSGWKNLTPSSDLSGIVFHQEGNIKFNPAGDKSYGYINIPSGCILVSAYMQEVTSNVGLRLGGFNRSSETGYTAWVDWDINDSIYLHWIYAKVS